MEKNSYIEEFKNRAKMLQVFNYIFIDIVHGFYIPEFIYGTLFLGQYEKSVIIYSGEEAKRQLIEFGKIKNIQFRMLDLYGDLIKVQNNTLSIEAHLLNNAENIVVWNANTLIDDVFNLMVRYTHNTPLFFIGDSEYHCYSKNIEDFLNRTQYYINDVGKIPSYNLEVIYLNKRIRTGDLTKLEETRHRSYDILKRNLFDIPSEEYLNYDMVISCYRSHYELNNEIRDMFSFEMIPNINEPMVNLHSFITTDVFGAKVYVPEYSIMKVVEVVNDAGYLYVTYEWDNHKFKVMIDTSHLHNVTGRNHDLIVLYSGGIKVEYAYVIIPLYSLNKTFDNVLILYSNKEHSSSRYLLNQLTMTARKRISIFSDHYYNLY